MLFLDPTASVRLKLARKWHLCLRIDGCCFQALKAIHNPESLEQAKKARQHFVFKELYLMQLSLILSRKFKR